MKPWGGGGTLSSVGQTRSAREFTSAPPSSPQPPAMALAESPSALSPRAPRGTKLRSPGPQASDSTALLPAFRTPIGVCQRRFLNKSQGPLLGSSLKPAYSSQPSSEGPPLRNPPALREGRAPRRLSWALAFSAPRGLAPSAGSKGFPRLQHNPCEFSLSPSLRPGARSCHPPKLSPTGPSLQAGGKPGPGQFDPREKRCRSESSFKISKNKI